jgi:uncharacterized protein
MACNWVREKGTMPPIELLKMFEIVPQDVATKIQELIEIKSRQNEDYLHGREPLIDAFLFESINQNEAVANDLSSGKGDIEKLDRFYREIVKHVRTKI